MPAAADEDARHQPAIATAGGPREGFMETADTGDQRVMLAPDDAYDAAMQLLMCISAAGRANA